MNIGESNRPSLVTGTDRSPAGAKPRGNGRILADMENRTPAIDAGTAKRGPSYRLLLLACAILAILVFLVMSIRLLWPDAVGRGDGDPASGRETFRQSAPATQAVPAAEPSGEVIREAAVIVDDATESPDAARARLSNALAGIGSVDAAEAMRTTDGGASAASGAAQPRRQAARTAARTAAPRAAAATEQGRDTDLLSTLLRIIKQDGTQGGTAEHESMDALVARIQAENDRTYHETNAALASLGGAARPAEDPVARSPVVQEKLRACPKANTVAGIECRDRVCAQHAGEDAACPRR